MISMTIIGNGNVAFHLIKTFLAKETTDPSNFVLTQVWARDISKFENSSLPIVEKIEALQPTDITIIAVSDRSIAEVSKLLPYQNHLVVHTSGSTPFSAIDNQHKRGVFYPLQTFSKTKEINFRDIPILIETENKDDFEVLNKLAHSISGKVRELNGLQRQNLHIAAVFACNFTNHLYALAAEICENHQIDFQMLLPLIEETTQKIKTISPKEAQTGPAKRNDFTTIEKHISLLENPFQKEIYQLLTQSIQTYDKKL